LLAQREVFESELVVGPKARDQCTDKCLEDVEHRLPSLAEVAQNINDLASHDDSRRDRVCEHPRFEPFGVVMWIFVSVSE
jgi:hypothetical protein